jgi:hypothetical protein
VRLPASERADEWLAGGHAGGLDRLCPSGAAPDGTGQRSAAAATTILLLQANFPT